jgi:dGTPase
MRRKLSEDIEAAIRMDNRAYDSSLSPFAAKNSAADRRRPDHEDIRRPFFHDGDRIMHSRAYARYIDKTQVFYLIKNDHITLRVLHVQLVSKIARMIGRGLLLNEDLIEAIALGHDIGHVPYGHDGEKYLSAECRRHGIGSFRHNVQSVRALDGIEGLNLTLQVLDGILAHNGEAHDLVIRPAYGKAWPAFEAEVKLCETTPDEHSGILPMTLEGCVVRVSDTISFIGRDIEDAITIGLITRADIPGDCAGALGDNNRDIVNNLVIDVIENSYGKGYVALSGGTAAALRSLREFNNANIYNNPKIKSEASKVERMFTMLFETFLEDLEKADKSSRIFKNYLDGLSPEKQKRYLDGTPNAGVVRDFIAGMTDDYFNDTFREIYLPTKRRL